MALNIAVPLSGVGGLLPISPIGIDCWENIKILVSPIGSESSGVSSLDSEEAKIQQNNTPMTNNDNNQIQNHQQHEKSPIQTEQQSRQHENQLQKNNDDVNDLLQKTHEFELKQLQQKPLQPMLLSSSPPKNISNINTNNDLNNLNNNNINKNLIKLNNKPQDLKIMYNGRDILDLGKNIIYNNKKLWNLKFTYLPENNNMQMFLANRSQYHRLGANGHIQEYTLKKCDNCDFQYPVNCNSSYFCQTSLACTTNVTTTPAIYAKNLQKMSTAIASRTGGIDENFEKNLQCKMTTTINQPHQPQQAAAADFSVNLKTFLNNLNQQEIQQQNHFNFNNTFTNPPPPPPQQQQFPTTQQQLTSTAVSSALTSPVSSVQQSWQQQHNVGGTAISPTSSGYNSSSSTGSIGSQKYNNQNQLQQNYMKNLNTQQQQQKISPTLNGGSGNLNGLNSSFYSFLNSFNNGNNNGNGNNYWNNSFGNNGATNLNPVNNTNSFLNPITAAVGGNNGQNNIQNCGQQQQNYARMYKYF